MSETEITWAINVLKRNVIKLEEQVKNLEAELKEIYESLENNSK